MIASGVRVTVINAHKTTQHINKDHFDTNVNYWSSRQSPEARRPR